MIKQFFKKFIHDIIKYLNKIPIGNLVFWRCTCSCFNVNIKFWLKCVYSNKKRRVALVIKEAHLTSTINHNKDTCGLTNKKIERNVHYLSKSS